MHVGTGSQRGVTCLLDPAHNTSCGLHIYSVGPQ